MNMEPAKIPFVVISMLLFTGSPVQARKSDGFQLRDLRVACSKEGMLVTVDFEEPFTGIIYSRGHYESPSCRYAGFDRGGQQRSSSVTFRVPLLGCGTLSEAGGREHAMSLENTLVIQADPDIQEAWDLARRIRCLWHDTVARTVTAKPFQVSQAGSEPLSFAEDSINAIMEVQEGKGPFSKPATGYLHLGEESSLVVYLQDPSRRLDARMVDCRAMGGQRSPSQLVLTDGQGCPVRPDLISPFYKTRDTRNTGADLIMYTNFRAFRLPDSSDFNIKCNMQICDKLCADYCTNRTRSKRDETGLRRVSQVDSKVDSNGGAQRLNFKMSFRGDTKDGWKGMSADSVTNLRLNRERKTDTKETQDTPEISRRYTPAVYEDLPRGEYSRSPSTASTTPSEVGGFPGPIRARSEDDLQGDLQGGSHVVPQVDLQDDSHLNPQGDLQVHSHDAPQGDPSVEPQGSDSPEGTNSTAHGDSQSKTMNGADADLTHNHSRGHKVLTHRVEVLTEEEVHKKKQLCFVQSSWVAICGVLGAGYLCLGIVVWVLILRIRAYGHLVKCLKKGKTLANEG